MGGDETSWCPCAAAHRVLVLGAVPVAGWFTARGGLSMPGLLLLGALAVVVAVTVVIVVVIWRAIRRD